MLRQKRALRKDLVISKNYNIANLSELGKLNFQGEQQFLPSLKARVSKLL